ncbi:hypothetical protein OL239_19110 [Arthrobacter sp. ATA002]|uniref:hypothetical protein n=1 Tax=Arthrobacter sp. ATA002 TaxID=2991715 RepID=UPI0022A78F4E|nr:hypothetical protein [Arthrobacter sp. ATA002]WAP51805.1 hypothetical protein OL239_19110 [Arthrobacter sp. ATA002]
MNSDSEMERRARVIVIARTVYKVMLVVWGVAVVGMLIIWWSTTPEGYFWPVWPALGLSVAALLWGLALYGRFPFRIREDKVAEEVERQRGLG